MENGFKMLAEQTASADSPETDEIRLVRERHDPLRILLRYGEQRPQDAHDPIPQLGLEALEDEIGVLLANG